MKMYMHIYHLLFLPHSLSHWDVAVSRRNILLQRLLFARGGALRLEHARGFLDRLVQLSEPRLLFRALLCLCVDGVFVCGWCVCVCVCV